MPAQRIRFIDLAKGICIILVIAHHLAASSPIYEFASCFHVPVFFCLSGLFFRPSNTVKEFLHKKINMILLPFVGWYLIAWCVNHAGHMIYDNLDEPPASLLDAVNQMYFYDIPLWFLLTLFWMNVIMSLIRRVTTNEYLTAPVVVLLMLGGWHLAAEYQLTYDSTYNFMHMASALSCLPFFYLGCLLRHTPLMDTTVSRRSVAMLGASALAIGCLCAFVPDRMPRMSFCYNYLWHDNHWLIYLCTISLVLGVILLCKAVDDIPGISWLGRYSLIVLVTHDVMGDIVGKLLYEYWGSELTVQAREYLNFAIVLALSVPVILFCRRYLPYITAQRQVPIADGLAWLQRKSLALIPRFGRQ